jgi:signal peptidase I
LATQIAKQASPETPAPQDSVSAAPPVKSTAREYLESLVVTVILALFGTTFLIQAFKIPSSSMEDTLLIGDHLMVDKVSYAPAFLARLLPYAEVQHDHIIVFRYPLDPGTYFVKRVVGIPGDHIRLEDKTLYRNGVALNEPYVVHKSLRSADYRDVFPSLPSPTAFPEWADELPSVMEGDELVVPPGRYFVMGDNRDFSSDSRYWGLVPRENIVGNPLVIYWSFETSSEEYRRTGLGDYATRLGEILFEFPRKTRWGRLFDLVQ